MDNIQKSGLLRNKLLKEIQRYKDLVGDSVSPDSSEGLCPVAVKKKLKSRINEPLDEIVKLHREFSSDSEFAEKCPHLVDVLSELSDVNYDNGQFDFMALLELETRIAPVDLKQNVQQDVTTRAPVKKENPFQDFKPS